MENINFNNTHSYNEILDALTDLKENGLFEGYRTGIADLDESFRLDRGKLCTITGIPNHGKSEFADYLCTKLYRKYKFKTLFFSAEDDLKTHINKILEKHNFADIVSIEDKARFISDNYTFINYDKVYTVDALFNVAESEMMRKPYDVLIIDPFNKLEAQKDYNVNMTDYISKFLDRLLRYTKKHNIITLLVAHPRKMSGDMIPSAYDIADSAHFFNKSDYCITVHATKEDFKTLIRVDKVKYKHLGYGGDVTLNYDDRTGNFYAENQTVYALPPLPLPELTPKRDYLNIEVDWFKGITDVEPKQGNLKDLLTGNNNVNANTNIENMSKLSPEDSLYKDYKQQLPNFCINARFNGNRAKGNVKELTGLIYIDIDYKDNREIINDIPDILKRINSVAFYKHSCSGRGYFAIVPYNSALKFEEVWHSLNRDFAEVGIKIDPSTKNPDRVTFYSNDPEYYINPNVEVYNKSMPKEQAQKQARHETTATEHRTTSYNTSANKKYVEGLITFLNERQTPLANDYHEWEQICLALISEFGEQGERYFIDLSNYYPNSNETDTVEFYRDHLNRYTDNNTVTFGTVKHYAEQLEYKLKS